VATYGSLRRQPEQRPQLCRCHFAAKLLAERQVKLVRVALGQFTQRRPTTQRRVGLTWADVDLAAGKLHIRRSVSWPKRRGTKETQARIYKPKTKSGTRTIPMRPELVAALKRWKLACPPTEKGWVFPGETGEPKHRSTIIHKGLHPACDAAGVPRVGIHSLRHTFASTLLAAGRTPAEVAALCGHKGPAVTMRIYAHWLANGHAADALDAADHAAS